MLKKYSLLTTLLLVIFIGTSCKKIKSFEYRDVRNIEVKSLGFNKSSLTMNLVYFNPNEFGVDLRKVNCDVFIDNNFFGKYSLDTLMHIKRRSEFALPSRIDIEMKGIYKNLYNVIFNKEIQLNVKGTAKVGKAGIFVNMPFNYNGKHTINFF
ncbi:MAG TPA: hypothetical protein PKG56_06735 [Chitinophagaceae bacterium]|nr:hypothetical protein [Chitinophagaceae bacterium]MCC6634337.1 LEA type 2 family protein [Chitinophagaceae bacterium]HNE92786.1 hypothetical protein [Chitinophagaceae bacterium]HNF30108.1 hypothetical protein [Chitinophagaceae bacterium]HNL83072.1 hypothetical protein [Chitinophagaceae bacterium]